MLYDQRHITNFYNRPSALCFLGQGYIYFVRELVACRGRRKESFNEGGRVVVRMFSFSVLLKLHQDLPARYFIKSLPHVLF